jgi:outer membrane protein TolC
LLERFVADRDAGGDFRLGALTLQLEQERLNFRITDVNLRPKFNVVTGAMQDEVSYTGSPSDRARIQSFYAGINLTWTVFDGYATRAQRKASLLRARQIEGERATRRAEVVERARNQARLLEIAQRQTAVGEGRLSKLDGLVRFQQEEVARGNLSRRDAASVALSRDEVLVRTFAYRVEYLGRLAEFLSVIGHDPMLSRLSEPRP